MSDSQTGMSAEGPAEAIIGVFRELYIEIFAVMIPGFCFILAIVPAFLIPLFAFLGSVSVQGFGGSLSSDLLDRSGVGFFAGLTLSYIIGHLLFRCDPKIPDTASIRARPADQWKDSCVEQLGNRREEYPYHNLKGYLSQRGFVALSEQVKWDKTCFADDAADEQKALARHRSKHFINRNKLDIKLRSPELFFEIARNETHVRLMSSVWYLSVAMSYCSAIGVVLGLFANTVSWRGSALTLRAVETLLPLPHGEAVFYPLCILILSIVTKEIIKKFFHYQRVREIVYVLEARDLIDSAAHG